MITKTFHKISHTLSYWFKGLLLTLLTAMPLGVVAEDFKVLYEKVSDSGVVVKSITGNVDGILEIPDEVTFNSKTYTVTGLSTDCFEDKTIAALSFENIIYYPFNIPSSFSNCIIKYLDLTSNYLSFDSSVKQYIFKECTIGRLVISKRNFDVEVLNSAKEITTLVCPDITEVPTGLTKVSTIIVPNAIASQSTDPKIKGFGDVSDHQAGKFFSFVAGEDLLFVAGGNVEAYVPREENPWEGDNFYLTHKNKTEDFVAAKGTALFLKIKDGSGDMIIPSVTGTGEPSFFSLIGSVTAARKTQSGKCYYALKKNEEGLFQYKGTFIPPGVAVVETDQNPPSTQTSPSGASVRAIKMVVGEQATAIETLQEEKVENIETCYDLFGNPSNSQSGEFRIINGKKVVRR